MRGGCCWVGRRLLLGWAVAVAGLGGGCCWVGRAAGRWTAAVRRRCWPRSRPTQRWVRIAGVETYPTLPSAGWGGAQRCARHRGWAGVGAGRVLVSVLRGGSDQVFVVLVLEIGRAHV